MPPCKGYRDQDEFLHCCRVHAHLFTGLVFALELHQTGNLGEKRVVASLANVRARMDLGAALPDDDGPRIDQLAVVAFYPEALCVAVSAVP